MILLIILLSYILGCASTIALLLYLYTSYAFSPPVIANEENDQQFEPFHPLPENERAKNSAVDAVNYLFQFLFQELKDSSRLRRYIMHKLDTEFKELKNSRTGKIFLQNIVIQTFSIGKECPVFSDIRLERQERDERNLIKEFVAKLDADYKDGFSVALDVTLLFGHKCQLFIKVKRIQGRLRLEFRREPFSHWLLVFQDEPTIDFEVKSYFAAGESPQVANIITQQLRRAMKRKQTWPSYKIRFQPFFSGSREPSPIEVLSAKGQNLIPGVYTVLMKYCDRLSIPLVIFDKQKIPSVTVFLTVNVNEKTCADYLHIDRSRWPTKEFELTRYVHKITAKEVTYMDRTEILIEQIEPLPSGIENEATFRAALEDRNVFLLQMQGQDVKTIKQMHRLLKYKVPASPNNGAPSSGVATNGNDDKIKIVIGMPLLHSVRVQRALESITIPETEKQGGNSPTLSIRNDSSATPTTLRHRTEQRMSAVKFDKNLESIGLQRKSSGGDDESVQSSTITNEEESSAQASNKNTQKKLKQSKNVINDMILTMMNAEVLQEFQAQPTRTKKAESFIEFNDKFEFQVSPNEQYLNICLWCKPPLDCDVPNAGKKLILLGYATVALSDIVLDAHLSYKRETQMTLNFRPAYSTKANLKKRVELSTHKGYDDNLAHGFITVNVKHKPGIEAQLTPQEQKEQFTSNIPTFNDLYQKTKEDEIKRDQLKYINLVNEQQESLSRRPTDHQFEDKIFTVATMCGYCKKKIWMKTGRQCQDCEIPIHKKCEERINAQTVCTREPIYSKINQFPSPTDDDMKDLVNLESNSMVNIGADDIDSMSLKSVVEPLPSPSINRTATNAAAATTTTATTTATTIAAASTAVPTTALRLSTKAAAAISALDSTARRSFRAFGNKNTNQTAAAATVAPNLSTTAELSKSDETVNNPSSIPTTKTAAITTTTNPPISTSAKLANAASSAYSRFRDFRSKRMTTAADMNLMKKPRVTTGSKQNENIAESDLRDIITQCLSDEGNDMKNLENLLHERAVDDTVLYAKAREFGPELFPELTPDERRQKIDSEISRLQQEIELQSQIRDEITHECESNLTDENEKRKLRAKIANIDEKVQALGALTILYCSGLEHCCTQMSPKESTNSEPVGDLLDDDKNNNSNDDFEDSGLYQPAE